MVFNIDTSPNVYRTYSDDPTTSKAFTDFKADRNEHLKLLFCIDMLNEDGHVDDISGMISFPAYRSPILSISSRSAVRSVPARERPRHFLIS